MDLTAPYRAAIPSLDGPVLRALAATTRPLTGLEVHRLAGTGSDTGVRKVLARLVDHGLVMVTEAGPSLLYTANRHHLAWPAVQALMTMRQRFIERLTSSVAAWEIEPVLVGLFGSAARGDGGVDSDIDLLVVRPDPVSDALDQDSDATARLWGEQVSALRDEARSATGNHIHVLELSASALRHTLASDESIVGEWRRDLVVLAGRPPWTGSGRPPERSTSTGATRG